MNHMLKSKRNFTEGPLFFRITLFALPIMLTGILQIAYNMADNIVVMREGRVSRIIPKAEATQENVLTAGMPLEKKA